MQAQLQQPKPNLRRCYSHREIPSTAKRVYAHCDCGDWAMCRWDGDGYSCPACDDYITEIHAAIAQCIVERRQKLNGKSHRSEYYREYYRRYSAARRERLRQQKSSLAA